MKEITGKLKTKNDSLARMIKIKDKTITEENSIVISFYNFLINTDRIYLKRFLRQKKNCREVLTLFNK